MLLQHLQGQWLHHSFEKLFLISNLSLPCHIWKWLPLIFIYHTTFVPADWWTKALASITVHIAREAHSEADTEGNCIERLTSIWDGCALPTQNVALGPWWQAVLYESGVRRESCHTEPVENGSEVILPPCKKLPSENQRLHTRRPSIVLLNKAIPCFGERCCCSAC